MKILLMGNPNVGKSVLFSKLTGISVVASNYPGTTIEFTKGTMKFGKITAEIIDVPGTYTLEPTNKAEEVAVEMLEDGDVIINVVDATQLERNLSLTLSLLEKKIPVIVALNIWDETKHKGITIDVKKLEKLLGVPVVPIVSVTGEGIKGMVSRLKEAKFPAHDRDFIKLSEDERWDRLGKIVHKVQTLTHRHHTFLERLEDAAIRPSTGIPIAIVSVLLVFGVVWGFGGRVLRGRILLPFFENIVFPPIERGVAAIVPEGVVREILIGHFGVLIDGIGWPLALVFPFLLAFYIALAILEDSGYLPRLACLLDSLFHRIGVHGGAVIPFLLGFGCTVGGVLSTRMLDTRRERIIIVTLMCIAIPCMAQTGAILALLGGSTAALVLVVLVAFLCMLIAGIILNKKLPGTTPSFLMEIPPFRRPNAISVAKKVWMRMKIYLTGAVPLIVLGVFIAAVLYETGILYHIGVLLRPIVVGLLGLPAEASVSLILGIVRRELAIAVLLDLHLTLGQLVVGAIVALLYIPCAAVFPVLIKEFGAKYAIAITISTIIIAFAVGGMLNAIFALL